MKSLFIADHLHLRPLLALQAGMVNLKSLNREVEVDFKPRLQLLVQALVKNFAKEDRSQMNPFQVQGDSASGLVVILRHPSVHLHNNDY